MVNPEVVRDAQAMLWERNDKVADYIQRGQFRDAILEICMNSDVQVEREDLIVLALLAHLV